MQQTITRITCDRCFEVLTEDSTARIETHTPYGAKILDFCPKCYARYKKMWNHFIEPDAKISAPPEKTNMELKFLDIMLYP